MLTPLEVTPVLASRTMAHLLLLSRQEVAWIFFGQLAHPNRKYPFGVGEEAMPVACGSLEARGQT